MTLWLCAALSIVHKTALKHHTSRTRTLGYPSKCSWHRKLTIMVNGYGAGPPCMHGSVPLASSLPPFRPNPSPTLGERPHGDNRYSTRRPILHHMPPPGAGLPPSSLAPSPSPSCNARHLDGRASSSREPDLCEVRAHDRLADCQGRQLARPRRAGGRGDRSVPLMMIDWVALMSCKPCVSTERVRGRAVPQDGYMRLG